MRFVATLHVRPKGEVRDPQGEAVAGALRSLGVDVASVRTGKEIVVTFDAADESAARDGVRTMGSELLANPVIEDYTYDLKELARACPGPRCSGIRGPGASATSNTGSRSYRASRPRSCGTRTRCFVGSTRS